MALLQSHNAHDGSCLTMAKALMQKKAGMFFLSQWLLNYSTAVLRIVVPNILGISFQREKLFLFRWIVHKATKPQLLLIELCGKVYSI